MTTPPSPHEPATAQNAGMRHPVSTRIALDGPIRARYDDARSPAPSRAELDWYAARLPRDAGVVLDAMCGSEVCGIRYGGRDPEILRRIAARGSMADGTTDHPLA